MGKIAERAEKRKIDAMKTFADRCHKQVNALPPEYRKFFMDFATNLTVMVYEMSNAEAYVIMDLLK